MNHGSLGYQVVNEPLELFLLMDLKANFVPFTVSVLMRKLRGCMRSSWNHSRQMILLVAKRLSEEELLILVIQKYGIKDFDHCS